jgi:predicted O-methyltransferase YrrM
MLPEESALIYNIALNIRPNRAVFMGSYNGFWVASAKVAWPETEIILLDLDPVVMELVRRNFTTLGLSSGDAEAQVKDIRDVDLLVAKHRGKATYYPHARVAFEALQSGGFMVAHNVILSNFANGPYFETKQQGYRKQYEKFPPFVCQHFRPVVQDTTQGMLVARKM